jgi:7-carboxy-7-deazaguanine synthase
MKISEIFFSIQGEGKWMGLPNIFIRTTGCNLRCSFCDTKYAYENGKDIDIKKIIEEVKKFYCNKICITGGEPLLQSDILSLINELSNLKYNICIETNGSLSIRELIVKKQVFISLDIKCPSSNMQDKMYFDNIQLLKNYDQLKFVINNKKDYNYSKKIILKYNPKCHIFLQPVWGTDFKKLAKWILDDRLNVKVGLQLHKILWGEKRGV